MHWRRKWQPTPGFLPGESQGRESGRQYLCRDTNGFREVGYLVKPGEWKFNDGAYMEEVIAWTELPGSDKEIIV